MRIAVLDDDAGDREGIAALVHRWASGRDVACEVAAFSHAQPFLTAHRMHPFDVALLDCYLNGDDTPPSGLDVARALRAAGSGCAIVFITSSLDFAVEGYEVEAVGYLVKPISGEKLAALLDRILKRCGEGQVSGTLLTLSTKDGVVRLHPGNILWVRSQGHYLDFCLRKGHRLRTRMTFRELEQTLEGDGRFYSSARGYLVNLDEVVRIEGDDFQLRCGDKVPISRSKRMQARQAYANRVFAHMRD